MLGAARSPWLGVVDAFLWELHPTYSPMCRLTSCPGVPWFEEGVMILDLPRVVTVMENVHLLPVENVTEVLLVPEAWCWNLAL